MKSSTELANLFFKDLKQYNITNFKTIERCDLSKEDAVIHKSFSSVVTRFFIFSEKHPEIAEADLRMLYFKLKIDMIARYFSEYPCTSYDDLRPFQLELQGYAKKSKEDDKNELAS